MEKDNRQAALKQLLAIAASNGYVTFDDIMRCADDNSFSIGDVDWLADMAGSRNVIIYEEAPKPITSDDDDYDDYTQFDYVRTFAEAIEMAPRIGALIDNIRSIKPPQRGEVGQLKYQVKEGNAHARKRMIEMYLRIAVRIAVSRAKAYDLDLEETLNDAFIGLIMAVDKYDPDHSGPFVSFASLWIYQYISREQSTCNPNIYFPAHRKEWYFTMYPLLKAQGCTDCDQILQCNKVVDMICEKVQCERNQAHDVLMASLPCLSLDELTEADVDGDRYSDSNDEMLFEVIKVKEIIKNYRCSSCSECDEICLALINLVMDVLQCSMNKAVLLINLFYPTISSVATKKYDENEPIQYRICRGTILNPITSPVSDHGLIIENAENCMDSEKLKETVHQVLSTLSGRKLDIIRKRFGFDGAPQTLEEIGVSLGVTRERIRQIEKKVIRQLGHSQSVLSKKYRSEYKKVKRNKVNKEVMSSAPPRRQEDNRQPIYTVVALKSVLKSFGIAFSTSKRDESYVWISQVNLNSKKFCEVKSKYIFNICHFRGGWQISPVAP